MAPIRLTSFGYLHLNGGPPPATDRTEDVRHRLRDPARARDILDLDGFDPRVQEVVLNTPGARELIEDLVTDVMSPDGPRSVAIGCAGGKHRACGLIEILGERLRTLGQDVEVQHLHAHLPRVLRKASS